MSYDDNFQKISKKNQRKNRNEHQAFDEAQHDYYRAFFTEDPDTFADAATVPENADRWSTWDQSTPLERGPEPHPGWLVTESAAVDYELGAVKSGKEADVVLLERAVPDTSRRCLLAAKRYIDPDRRQFRRDHQYRDGRGHPDARAARAIAKRTAFGLKAHAAQWAYAEFSALRRMWSAGVAVPYPVQILGTEICMEFIGTADGDAAPRLARMRCTAAQRDDLWEQLVESLSAMARTGYTHGDLSAYNVIVDDGRLVIIDLPQTIDVIVHPNGSQFLERDVHHIGSWFVSAGLPARHVTDLTRRLFAETGVS